MYNPSATIKFYNVPWTDNYNDVRYFSSGSARDSWHNNRSGKTFEAITTVKLGKPIKVHASYEEMLHYGYCRFRDSHFSDRWIYAFVKSVEWGADRTTIVEFEEDIYQTWLDKFIFTKSYIERQHTVDDKVTYVPEPIGKADDEIFIGETKLYTATTYRYFCLCSVSVIGGSKVDNNFTTSASISEGIALYSTTDKGDFWLSINELENKWSGSVKMCYAIPTDMIASVEEAGTAFDLFPSFKLLNSIAFNNKSVSIPKPTLLDGYTPRNKKCFTYPFCYCIATNFTGQTREYKFELTSGNLDFETRGRIGANVTAELFPSDYSDNADYLNTVKLEDAPKLGFSGDYFNGWMQRNSTNLIASAITAGTSVATGNMVGGAVAGLGILGNIQSQSASSNNMNVPSTSMAYLLSQHRYGFSIFTVCAKKSYIEYVDDYFQRYGYAFGKVREVSLKNRDKFTYVKTSGATVRGSCPNYAKAKMEKILDTGVTSWNVDDIGDYNVENN